MADFFVAFKSSGVPVSGLSPTFTIFQDIAGNAITPPAIAEINTSGIYGFTFQPTLAISFVCSGVTTGLPTTERFVIGSINPNDELAALTGDLSSSFGDSVLDPTTIFGYLKLAQEILEGNQTYIKATGVLEMYSRGSSALLITKTISDSATEIEKI